METRTIGSLEVSVVGLGTNNFGMRLDQQRTAAVVGASLDAGINFFDTADVYGATKSEEFLGNALKGRRDEAIVATKFGVRLDDEHPGGGTPEYVRVAVEESLRRLSTDRIDLFILHWPDPQTPLAVTLEALDGLVRAGKVREIGASNLSIDQMREADAAVASSGGARFVSVQNQYNLLERAPERDVLPECVKTGVAFVPYFPLASGLLTGKYRRDEAPAEGTRMAGMPEDRRAQAMSDRNFDIIERLGKFCEQRRHTMLELAMSWLIAQDGVASVIAGATSPEQVRENVAAAGWKLTADDLNAVDEAAPLE